MPGTMRVTAAALAYAQEFAASIGASQDGRYVTTFDWAQSIGVRENAEASLEQLGPCLLLASYERRDVPPNAIQRVGQFEFAVKIPPQIWKESQRRLIDVDKSQPFGLVLR